MRPADERAAKGLGPGGVPRVVRPRPVVAKVDKDLHHTGWKTAFPRVRGTGAFVVPEQFHEVRERRPGYVDSTGHTFLHGHCTRERRTDSILRIRYARCGPRGTRSCVPIGRNPSGRAEAEELLNLGTPPGRGSAPSGWARREAP